MAVAQAGREDLRSREEAELKILEAYLPQQLSDAEIETAVQKLIAEQEWTVQDFGSAMGMAMARLKGQADGGRVSEILKRLLSS